MKDTEFIGKDGEQRAAEFLESEGYTVVTRNYRYLHTEIDIIAKKDGVLAFIEVKASAPDSISYSVPSKRVTEKKMESLIKCAKGYIATTPRYVYHCKDYRFDVIEVEGEKITHIENAFDMRKERTWKH